MPQRLLRLLERNTTAPRRLLTRRRLVRHFANSAGTRPKFTRCRAIGYTGGRNGTCRIAVVVGNSHSHSLAHVGARLVALGSAEPTRTYATAHEWHLLFSGPDPLKERAMQQPKTKHDRSAYEQSVDRLASAMREMLGMGAAQDGNVGTNKNRHGGLPARPGRGTTASPGRWPDSPSRPRAPIACPRNSTG
jgi:hypothetical protein